MRNLNFLFLLLLLSLGALVVTTMAGCATFEETWKHPEGKSQAEFRHDAADCRHQWVMLEPWETEYYKEDEPQSVLGLMAVNANINPQFFADCMAKKGWQRIDQK